MTESEPKEKITGKSHEFTEKVIGKKKERCGRGEGREIGKAKLFGPYAGAQLVKTIGYNEDIRIL